MSAGEERKGERVHKRAGSKTGEPPDWAEGLKRLYNSVVEEPLPDSFKELLSRLDDDEQT